MGGFDSYNDLNNMQEISFIAGTETDLIFNVYNENGIDLLGVSSAEIKFCPYGIFSTASLTKAGTVVGSQVTFSLVSSDTENLSGKYIHQITIIDSLGKTLMPGQGTIIIIPQES